MAIITDSLKLWLDAVYPNGFTGQDGLWADLSGLANRAVPVSSTFEQGAVHLTGGDSVVEAISLNSTAFTLELLFTPDSIPSKETLLFGNRQTDAGFAIEIRNSKYSCAFKSSKAWEYLDGTSASLSKCHVAATFADKVLTLFVNGRKVASKTTTSGLVLPTNNKLVVGSLPSLTQFGFFSGNIHSARYYARSLSEEEIYLNFTHDAQQFSVSDRRYLIKSGEVYYTVVDGIALATDIESLSASVFRERGFIGIPSAAVLASLSNAKLLYWQNSRTAVPAVSITVSGASPTPQVLYTPAQSIANTTIKGIESAKAESSDDVLFAFSFDNKQTWKAFQESSWVELSEESSGMSKQMLESLGVDIWAQLITSTEYFVRIVLPSTTSSFTSLTIDYLN